MAARSIQHSGRHSSASYARPSSSAAALQDSDFHHHPGGIQSAHQSRASSRQHHHHRHHHHHHHRRHHRDDGVSFISEEIKRPKSRQLKIEDDVLDSVPDHELILVPTDPEKQFCKRSQHQTNCAHQKKKCGIHQEVLMDIVSEERKKVKLTEDKKTNTPRVPSMMLIPASAVQHENDCPLRSPKSASPSRFLPGQGDHALFSPPSSSSGTDSSLRIRRNRSICTERRWFISVSLAMVITLVIAAGGIYFGYQFLKAHLPEDEQRVFRGEFVVTRGDFIPIASDAAGLTFVQTEKAKFYRRKLDQIFGASQLSKSFLFNEVLLLEGLGPKGVKVHFNVHTLAPEEGNITSNEIYQILKEQIELKDPANSFLAEIEVDSRSLIIEERSPDLPPPRLRESSGINFVYPDGRNSLGDKNSQQPGRCTPFQIDFCKELPYNYTTLPNGLGHANLPEMHSILDSFKPIIDSKCHNLAYEFLCQLLQPVCYMDKSILPCRDFCLEFLENCEEQIPPRLRTLFHCDEFLTEADGPGSCISKPGCVTELRNTNKGDLICDGVVDCPDFSDELYCPYCPEHHFHCGVAKTCIPKEKLCDGTTDCDNGADERGCLSLSKHRDFASYIHQYYQSGYLTFQDSGEVGRVCADNIDANVPNVEQVLTKLGHSTCSLLEYDRLVDIQVVKDDEAGSEMKYVDIISPVSGDATYANVPCSSKNVINITCDGLRCGQRPSYVPNESRNRLESRRDIAMHGDWPWMIALYKNGLHVCDATLVSDQWIMTTASCFQGQGKAKWTARFASVRLQSRAPWEQKRTIVGMIKSPVEGNSIVLLKMDEAIVFSDFARPICVPEDDDFIDDLSNCVTLGWTLDSDELNKVYVRPTNKTVCEEISEASANTLCTKEDTAPGIPCSGEEFAGAPLMCQYLDSWYLLGILAWRKGCSTVGQRPRLYDRVAVTSDWMNKVMLKLDNDRRVPRYN